MEYCLICHRRSIPAGSQYAIVGDKTGNYGKETGNKTDQCKSVKSVRHGYTIPLGVLYVSYCSGVWGRALAEIDATDPYWNFIFS